MMTCSGISSRSASTALSLQVDVRIMRYEGHQASISRAGRTAAGAGRVSASLSRPLRPFRGHARLGTLPHGDAHRASQQELRYHRPGRPQHLRAVPPRVAHRHALGPGRTEPATGPRPAGLAHRGRRRLGHRRHRLRQAGPRLRRRPTAILRDVGQSRQLSGQRQLPLCRTHHRLARRHPLVPAQGMGRRLDSTRRDRAKVPQDVAFQTKPQIALALLDQADQMGVAYACVVADADYGDNPNFLRGLEQRGKPYVTAVRKDFLVALAADGPAQPAEAVLARQPARAWRTIRWRQGSKGWLKGRFTAVRGWRAPSAEAARVPGWLIGEQTPAGERKSYFSNFGVATTLAVMVEYAHRRYGVEKFHEEAKGLLGWDQYQGRLWTGFHRHSVLVMLAYSFLVVQEWQQRRNRTLRGRPRGAFSPSGRPPTPAAAGDPSTHL